MCDGHPCPSNPRKARRVLLNLWPMLDLKFHRDAFALIWPPLDALLDCDLRVTYEGDAPGTCKTCGSTARETIYPANTPSSDTWQCLPCYRQAGGITEYSVGQWLELLLPAPRDSAPPAPHQPPVAE